MIPTKQEFLAIQRKMKIKEETLLKQQVARHIEQISDLIRIGKFKSRHISSHNPEVIRRICKAFTSKGYKVSITNHDNSDGRKTVSLTLSIENANTKRSRSQKATKKKASRRSG